MASQVFINLPVTDLQKSADLYSQIGFTNNPQFSDESAKCMVWSDTIFVMLMTRERMTTFTNKPIGDTKTGLTGIFALSVNSPEQVHELAEKAIAAGGIEAMPFKDYGFMQQRTIEDYDGHTWEVFFMDISKFPQPEAQ